MKCMKKICTSELFSCKYKLYKKVMENTQRKLQNIWVRFLKKKKRNIIKKKGEGKFSYLPKVSKKELI